jgi:hypothetical protein
MIDFGAARATLIGVVGGLSSGANQCRQLIAALYWGLLLAVLLPRASA